MDAFTIIGQLKAMFQEQARQERVNTIKAFVNYKLAKGSPVSPYVLKMKSYTAKLNIKSSSEVLMVQKGKNPKKRERDQGKGKEKVVVKASKVDALAVPRPRPKPKEPKPPKEGECYFCKKIEHWKRKCPLYLEELKKNKGSIPSTSGT
ncbi:putative retrotransposon protein [Cucumis melo var. makuwa]|uniref:Putative retrotransposon protein n=1 Tax=Cucumis melo var. makuwa TaxID=1194695 RepID=A0A5D3C6L2_CUCMM|nr:putative retrotransposon protein [Cucumis melo var. makuwa]